MSEYGASCCAAFLIVPTRHRLIHSPLPSSPSPTSPTSPTILIARDAHGGIIGSVQLHTAWAPNQPHRGDVGKLLVHRSARGTGLGRALMQHIERAARERRLSLLTLDCKSGGVAEHLYRSLHWTHAGTIPNYALDPDGKAFHATEVFYKSV